jgi:hypothetical protein
MAKKLSKKIGKKSVGKKRVTSKGKTARAGRTSRSKNI